MRFEDRGFPSVRELLDYHVQNKINVTKKSQAILVNPVLKEKDKWEMRREDIILKDKLGQGHFGDVMKGILKPSNLPVAVKSCKESVSASVKKKFLAEAEILKQYDHPNIVKLIGVCADREPVFIGKLINGYPTRNNNSLRCSCTCHAIPTIMDKSLATLAFLGVFQFTQVQPLPSLHKQCWTRVSRIFSEF